MNGDWRRMAFGLLALIGILVAIIALLAAVVYVGVAP